MKRLTTLTLLIVTVIFPVMIVFSPVLEAYAQEESWSAPVNLSRSGSAFEPRLLASKDGRLQAFWWDRFDGLTTSLYTPTPEPVWADPILAPIASEALKTTPTLMQDGKGLVHAFWTESNLEGNPRLMHSMVPFGQASWSAPEVLSASVSAFTVVSDASGTATLAYIRTLQDSEAPAGLYVKHFDDQAAVWGPAKAAFTSIYFRSLAPENAWISLAANQQAMFLGWNEPRHAKAFLTVSTDHGETWSQPQSLGDTSNQATKPLLAVFSKDQTILFWQSMTTACGLFQQELSIPEETANKNAGASTGSNSLGQANQISPITLSEPEPIFTDLVDCPQSGHFWVLNNLFYWLWGEGSEELHFAAWDPQKREWSTPNNINPAIKESDLQPLSSLVVLQADMENTNLAVIGIDDKNGGDVWVTVSSKSVLDLAFTPSSAWSIPQRLPTNGQMPSTTSLIIDDQDRTHLVWSLDTIGAPLYYAMIKGEIVTTAEIIPSSSNEVARHPALFYEPARDRLHLAWSGGSDGSIYYSWANTNEARIAEGWSPPETISSQGAAAWPQIGMDSTGKLYILYIVPLNEGRCVYLVSSENGGKTWSPPSIVFDAAAANWQMIDHPTLAIAPDGSLFAAWVHSTMLGAGTSQGIYFSLSRDGGLTWSEPLVLASAGFDWPHLVISTGQIHLLYAKVTANTGDLYHRKVSLDQLMGDGSGWYPAQSVPGWQNVALPYGLSASGSPARSPGVLHLAAASSVDGTLRYATWDGSRWSPIEILDEGKIIGSGLGVNAVTPLAGGAISVIWMAKTAGENPGEAALFILTRTIPKIDMPSDPVATPTLKVMPSPSPQFTATAPIQLTATPDLNKIPTTTNSDMSPIILGGGLAGLVVIAFFSLRIIRGVKLNSGR